MKRECNIYFSRYFHYISRFFDEEFSFAILLWREVWKVFSFFFFYIGGVGKEYSEILDRKIIECGGTKRTECLYRSLEQVAGS